MSTVVVQADRIFEDILNASIREEKKLERVEQVIIDKHRKWWNAWAYKSMSDKDIVDHSIQYGLQRCHISSDIDKLKALAMMCGDAIRDGTTFTLCRKDYELIYKGN